MSHAFSPAPAPSPSPSHLSPSSMADPNLQSRPPPAAYASPHSYPSPSMQSTYTYPSPQGQQSTNEPYRDAPAGPNMAPRPPSINLPPIRLQDGQQQPQQQQQQQQQQPQQQQQQQQPPPPPPPPPQQPPPPAQPSAGSPLAPPHVMPQYYAHPGHAPTPLHIPNNSMGPAQFNAMRYQLPPQGDARVLSGGRHKKEIKRRTKTGCLTCRKRRIKVSVAPNSPDSALADATRCAPRYARRQKAGPPP